MNIYKLFPVALVALLLSACQSHPPVARTLHNGVNTVTIGSMLSDRETPAAPFKGRTEVVFESYVKTVFHEPSHTTVLYLKPLSESINVYEVRTGESRTLKVRLPEDGVIGRVALEDVRDRYNAFVEWQTSDLSWLHTKAVTRVKESPVAPYREWTRKYVKLTVVTTLAYDNSDVLMSLLATSGARIEIRPWQMGAAEKSIVHLDFQQLKFGEVRIPHPGGVYN